MIFSSSCKWFLHRMKLTFGWPILGYAEYAPIPERKRTLLFGWRPRSAVKVLVPMFFHMGAISVQNPKLKVNYFLWCSINNKTDRFVCRLGWICGRLMETSDRKQFDDDFANLTLKYLCTLDTYTAQGTNSQHKGKSQTWSIQRY